MSKIDFVKTIRQMIADGKTEEAVAFLTQHIAEYDATLANDAALLESRYNVLETAFVIKGVMQREEFDRGIAQINYAILEFLENLVKTVVTEGGSPKDKTSGKLLHNIPGVMPLQKETRCIVRIAYDELTVAKDFVKTADTVIQSVRIAEVMSVELVDFNETPTFQIRTATGAEQFIVTDDYTQWIFMVKPLRVGTFPLMLKVAVLEEIEGKERRRDIVLEKEIFIIAKPEVTLEPDGSPVTEGVSPSGVLAFEDTQLHIDYATKELTAKASETAPPETSPAAPAAAPSTINIPRQPAIEQPKRSTGGLRAGLAALAILFVGIIGFMVLRIGNQATEKGEPSFSVGEDSAEIPMDTIAPVYDTLQNKATETIRSYSVKIKTERNIKDIDIIVNGEKPFARKYIDSQSVIIRFKTQYEKQSFLFRHNKDSCQLKNILIKNDSLELNTCPLK